MTKVVRLLGKSEDGKSSIDGFAIEFGDGKDEIEYDSEDTRKAFQPHVGDKQLGITKEGFHNILDKASQPVKGKSEKPSTNQ